MYAHDSLRIEIEIGGPATEVAIVAVCDVLAPLGITSKQTGTVVFNSAEAEADFRSCVASGHPFRAFRRFAPAGLLNGLFQVCDEQDLEYVVAFDPGISIPGEVCIRRAGEAHRLSTTGQGLVPIVPLADALRALDDPDSATALRAKAALLAEPLAAISIAPPRPPAAPQSEQRRLPSAEDVAAAVREQGPPAPNF